MRRSNLYRYRRGLLTTMAGLAVLGLTWILGTAHAVDPRPPRRIAITVDETGFSPRKIDVAKDQPVVLVFTRTTDATCARKVIVYLSDDEKLERDLPLRKPVELTVRFARAGELGYACAMGHVAGIIRVH